MTTTASAPAKSQRHARPAHAHTHTHTIRHCVAWACARDGTGEERNGAPAATVMGKRGKCPPRRAARKRSTQRIAGLRRGFRTSRMRWRRETWAAAAATSTTTAAGACWSPASDVGGTHSAPHKHGTLGHRLTCEGSDAATAAHTAALRRAASENATHSRAHGGARIQTVQLIWPVKMLVLVCPAY
jgi:hypothetical protein